MPFVSGREANLDDQARIEYVKKKAERIPKKSAKWYARVTRENGFEVENQYHSHQCKEA